MNSSHIWRAFHTELLNLATGGSFDKQKQLFTVLGVSTPISLNSQNPQAINFTVYSKGMIVPAWSSAWAPKSDIISTYPIFLNTVLASHPGLTEGQKQNLSRGLENAIKIFSQGTIVEDVFDSIAGEEPDLDALSDFDLGSSPEFDASSPLDTLSTPNLDLDGAPELDVGARLDMASLPSLDAHSLETWLESGWDDLGKEVLKTQDQVFQQFLKLDTADLLPIDWNKIKDTDAKTLTTALNDYQAAVSPLPNSYNMAANIAGQTRHVPVFTLSDFAETYKEWTNNSAGDKTRIKINQESETISPQDMGLTASANAASKGDFIKDSEIASSVAQIDISFAGFGTFDIRPGRWFKLGVISTYKQGLAEENPFFGPGGSMSLVPYRLLIGFQPELTLKIDEQAYKEHTKTPERFQSQTVGPFKLEQGRNTRVEYRDERSEITFRPSGSSVPVLLGVICTKL